MLHFLCILTISFGVFSAIVGTFTVALPWMMAYVYSKDNSGENEEELPGPKRKQVLMMKILNVADVFLMFMLLFGSDFYFDIAQDLDNYTVAV